jgi:hypothetical protein
LLSGSSPFYQKGCLVITEKLDGGNCKCCVLFFFLLFAAAHTTTCLLP